MTKLNCGCSDIPRDRKLFLDVATAVEHRVGLFAPPSAKVLTRWNNELQKATNQIEQTWVAWQAFTHPAAEIRKGHGLKLLEGEDPKNLGLFQDTAENRRVWEHIKLQAQNVGAKKILLETPASFVPSQRNKDALKHFVQDWALLDKQYSLVWHPAGFWDAEEASEVAQNLGLILAVDPLVDEKEPLPEGNTAYFQMLGRHGLMDSYSDDDLECILERCAQYEEVTVIFRTCESLYDAYRLRKLAEETDFEDIDFPEPEEEEDFEDEDGDEEE